MPIHEAEGIVLRQYSLSEADRIVVLVTREAGKLRLVAHGVKKPKSRASACVEPLTHARFQFYGREGSELSHLRQCEAIHSYLGRNATLEQMYAFTYFAEIAQETVEDNNPNPLMFRLLLATLEAGETVGGVEALVRYFELWSVRLNGWLPDYGYCSDCGTCVKDSDFYVAPESGQGRCSGCAGRAGLRMRRESAQTLPILFQLSPEEFSRRPLPAAAGYDLGQLAQMLFELHLEKKLKAHTPLKQLFGNEAK
jgi:DNA repair protein RecO (recombination protein O)